MENDTTMFGRVCEWAYRLRWLLAVPLVLMLLGAIALVAFNTYDDDWIGLAIFFTAFFGTQVLFLLPRRHWPVKLAKRGRPLWISLVIGAAVAAIVSLGLIAAILEIPDWWDRIGDHIELLGLIAVLGIAWLIWSILFFVYFRGPDAYGALSRMVRRLFVGSILEMLVSVPVLIFVPDRHDCACARGSFFGVAFGTTAILWLFGPGVVLVFLHRKMRAQRAFREHEKICTQCEYDLRGTIAAGRTQCPECGAWIDPELLASTPTN